MSLATIKSGRFLYDNVTRKVTPHQAQGQINIKWLGDQKHFIWTNKNTNTDELDIIVFPQDAKFTHYKDNIFILWFQTYEDKHFFWLIENQQPVADIQKRIQDAINQQQPPIEESSKMIVEEHPDEKPKAAEVQKPAISAKKVEGMKGLQGMIERIMQKNKDQKDRLESMGLLKLFSGNLLNFLEQNPTPELISFLPEGQQNQESLRDNLYSPQLQQALDNFEDAVNSDSAPSLFYELNLDLKFLETHFGTEALLKALEKWGKEQKSEDNQKK